MHTYTRQRYLHRKLHCNLLNKKKQYNFNQYNEKYHLFIQGDDGAGYGHVDTVSGRMVLVGMPSYGVGCSTRQPRVAVRVSFYIPWLLQTTNEPFCVI